MGGDLQEGRGKETKCRKRKKKMRDVPRNTTRTPSDNDNPDINKPNSHVAAWHGKSHAG